MKRVHSEYPTLRTCIFRPYGKGKGPVFYLGMYATPRTDSRGQTTIGYVLSQGAGMSRGLGIIFRGEDFHGSPLHADDSDETVACLMSFLTLRPGDTDPDYFANYTDAQRAFCEQHAEALSLEVMNRYGEV